MVILDIFTTILTSKLSCISSLPKTETRVLEIHAVDIHDLLLGATLKFLSRLV